MTVTTQRKSAARKPASSRLDLSGQWPIIRGVEWDDERYFDRNPYDGLTDDEEKSLTRWLVSNGREIRATRIGGKHRFMHYPDRDVVEISTLPLDRIELCVNSKAVRHADEVSITVVNTNDKTEAEEKFLQWLEDVTKHFAARRSSNRLTA